MHNILLFVSANFDYVPVNKTVSFESELSQCVDILIVNDDLIEAKETFTVSLLSGREAVSSVNVIITNNGMRDLILFSNMH